MPIAMYIVPSMSEERRFGLNYPIFMKGGVWLANIAMQQIINSMTPTCLLQLTSYLPVSVLHHIALPALGIPGLCVID